jgi:hypothetical protein
MPPMRRWRDFAKTSLSRYTPMVVSRCKTMGEAFLWVFTPKRAHQWLNWSSPDFTLAANSTSKAGQALMRFLAAFMV